VPAEDEADGKDESDEDDVTKDKLIKAVKPKGKAAAKPAKPKAVKKK
jgi:hypothetical protein